MKRDYYELRAAKARQASLREESGWRPPVKYVLLPKPPRVAKPKPDLWKIAQAIMGAVGDAVPDGDPIDRLIPIVRRECGLSSRGEPWEAGCDVSKWLDKACRKYLYCRSYNRYLINAWDGWNEICQPDQRMENPWRPRK